jgi:hypothetical protein
VYESRSCTSPAVGGAHMLKLTVHAHACTVRDCLFECVGVISKVSRSRRDECSPHVVLLLGGRRRGLGGLSGLTDQVTWS